VNPPLAFMIDPTAAGERLDAFLVRHLAQFSRSKLQQCVKKGDILVDGTVVKPGFILRPGMRVEILSLQETEPPPADAVPEEIPLDILYEDSSLIVVNKPAGLVVHPAAGNWSGTLVNALLFHSSELADDADPLRPGIVHRLDKETSGCLVIAKHNQALASLAEQFSGREVKKEYLAVAEKAPRPAKGRVETHIARHPVHRQRMTVVQAPKGRLAITEYETLSHRPGEAVILCRLLTGRTHQIRVHLKHLGCPLLGDPVYGKRGRYDRHMLHAWKLGLHHPETGKWMEFAAPIPDAFAPFDIPVS
jgi:23S rRNA pseudouridine1911/1915/1917 synthase